MDDAPAPRTRRANRESWVSDKPNARGYYEAFVWMGTRPDGKPDRRRIQRKTLKSVRSRVRELERHRDEGRVVRPGKALTVTEMMDRHLNVILLGGDRAPKTIYSYRSLYRSQILPRWGSLRIDQLLPEHIEDGIADMKRQGHANSYIRKVLTILSSAYDIQVRRDAVARNPCKMVKAPKIREQELPTLSETEAQSVLAAAAGDPNYARWVIGLICGLRQGEALGLRWQYVDMANSRLRIWHQIQRLAWEHGCKDIAKCAEGKHRRPCPARCPKAQRKSGRRHVCVPGDAKGLCPAACTGHASTCPQRRGGGLVFRSIKEARRKTLYLDEDLVALLKRHRDEQFMRRLLADREWEENDLVFTQWNGKPVDPRRDWEDWSKLLKSAGLPHHRLHAMRHSSATIALGQGIPLAVVQQMLGHSDIRVTRRYTHVGEALGRDAVGRIGKAILGPKNESTATTSATTESDDHDA